MPRVPMFNDELRLKILHALLEKGALKADVIEISKKTSLSIVKVKKVLRYFEEEYGLRSFYPVLYPKAVGFNLLVLVFMKLDLSKKEAFGELLHFLEKETTVISANKIIGSGKWNFVVRVVAHDLNDFDKLMTEKVATTLKGANELILDQQYVFIEDTPFVITSRVLAVFNGLLNSESKEHAKGPLLAEKQKVFNCFLGSGYIKPNVKQIKRLTGLHTSTIRASLNYLFENKIIERYAPAINFSSAKLKFFVFDLFKINFSDKEPLEELKKVIAQDKNLAHAGPIFGDPEHNLFFMHAYNSIEDYMSAFKEKYLSKKELSSYLSSQMTFFTTTYPLEAKDSWPNRSTALIKTLIRDSGKDLDN